MYSPHTGNRCGANNARTQALSTAKLPANIASFRVIINLAINIAGLIGNTGSCEPSKIEERHAVSPDFTGRQWQLR